MAITDTYHVKMRFFQEGVGKFFAPGFSIRQTGGTAPTAATMLSEVTALWTEIKSLYDPSTLFHGVTLRRVLPLEAMEDFDAPAEPIAGTAASTDPLPVGTAVVVNLRTANIGKSYRGRIYLPAVAESEADQTLGATQAGLIADEFEALRASLLAAGYPMAIWSRELELSTLVTSVRVDRRIRSQRRRQVRAPSYVDAS